MLGVDCNTMVADGKVQHCFHWFWEAYATLEGWSDFFKLGVLVTFYLFFIPQKSLKLASWTGAQNWGILPNPRVFTRQEILAIS